jgi:ABC-2 type transport system permease protein
MFFNPTILVDEMIRHGEFDRYLVRPLNPLVSAMTTRALRMGGFGDTAAGIAIILLAANHLPITWSAGQVVAVFLAVVGGALVETALQLFLAALAFRWLETSRLRGIVGGPFGSYPLKVFGDGVAWTLTFLVPVAFVAYLPASVLLGKKPHS